MIIVADIGFQQTAFRREQQQFLEQVLKRIAAKHPEHSFILIGDKEFEMQGLKTIKSYPIKNHPIVWKWWCNLKLPALLKKNKADVLVSLNHAYPINVKLPQCLFVPDFDYIQKAVFFKKPYFSFLQKNMHNCLQKADSIATVSSFSKKQMAGAYPDVAGKLNEVCSAADEVVLITQEDKQTIKEKYTEGKEYFVYTGLINEHHTLVILLKAFSIFKQRQKSNMKLVLINKPDKPFLSKLDSYKYRYDVVIAAAMDEEEEMKILSAAYAMVYPSQYDGFALPVLQAMKCGVPVITNGESALQEFAGDAALYAASKNQQEIAEQLMRIYKDENLRNKLIAAGEERSKNYSWDKTAEQFWQCIAKAMGE
jgi:glycosyltransferase involved in cell wall biosynthesis